MPRTITVAALVVALLVGSIGCSSYNWVLIDEGVLTDVRSTSYCTELTFDHSRIYLLREGIYFDNPLILGAEYYLYHDQRGVEHYRLDPKELP